MILAGIDQQIAIAVIVNRGKVVIGQRPPHARLAGYWEFPGGHVEAGESIAQAAIRETWEETGLTIRVGEVLAESTVLDGDRVLQLAFLACSPTEPGDPALPFRWVDCHLLSQFTFPSANHSVVEWLTRSV